MRQTRNMSRHMLTSSEVSSSQIVSHVMIHCVSFSRDGSREGLKNAATE